MLQILFVFIMLLAACIPSIQAQTAVTYRAAVGKSGRPLVENKYGHYNMQAAHEDLNVIYAKAGAINLKRRNDTFRAYARWYNYNTNRTMPGLTLSETADYTSANGQFRTRANSDVSGFTATYQYDGTSVVRIACDQSAYTDYQLNGSTLTEPTISQRIIYEIRPASEMAARVDQYTGSEFMENYELMAPTGQTIYLGPQYTFNKQGDYPSYFFKGANEEPVWMNTTAFTAGSSASTEGEWQSEVVDQQTTTIYRCRETYTEPAATSKTTTMNRTTAVPNEMTGSFQSTDGTTWNYTRKKYSRWNSQVATPSYDSSKGLGFGSVTLSFSSLGLGENVVFSVSELADKRITKVKVIGSSDYKALWGGGYHSIEIKVGDAVWRSPTMNKNTTSYEATGIGYGDVIISFTARASTSILYVKSIEITYEVEGRGQTYTKNFETTEEPPAAYASKWNKVVTEEVTTAKKKIDVSSTTSSSGWQWKVGSDAQTNPNTFSGQFIQASSTSAGVQTYELSYIDGGGKTITTTTTRADKLTTVTTYTYESNWGNPTSSTSTTNVVPETSTYVEEGTEAEGSGVVFKIARFKVQYMNKTAVGPGVEITNRTILRGMDTLVFQDFNYDRPGTTNTRYYTTPLAVDESTFGFYYGSRTDRMQNNTYWNEYCFVNNGYGYTAQTNVSNHKSGETADVDAAAGYALYVDGSQKPGTVFSLNFNAELCSNTTMYFSAWIGDQNNGSNTPPIFDFIVVGEDLSGNETTLATFTTGKFESQQGWKRIIFPLAFNASADFANYKLKIVNKAATTSGNDFFIDDIGVFIPKSPITLIQASTPSSECFNQESDVVLYTRVDYKAAGYTTNFYYRWYDENGNVVDATYLNKTGNAGKFTVLADRNISADDTTKVYPDFATIDELYHNTRSAKYRLVSENYTDPSSGKVSQRYVAYIVTPIPNAKLGAKYTCVVAGSVAQLDITDDNFCENSASLVLSKGMNISSEKAGGMLRSEQAACANYSYDLTLSTEYAVLEGNKTVKKSCNYLAHWLYGKEPAAEAERSAFRELYGASFKQIEDALTAHNGGSASQEQQALIKRLVRMGLLVLAESLDENNPVYSIAPLSTAAEVSYTVFPVRSLCDDAPVCHEPQSITLRWDNSGNPDVQRNVMYFVKEHNEQVPAFVASRPRRVRIIEGAEAQAVSLDLSDRNNTYKIKSMVLHATDDAKYKDAVGVSQLLSAVPVSATGQEQTEVTSATDAMLFSGLSELAADKYYTLRLVYEVSGMEDGKEECTDNKGKAHDGEAFITFLVVPDMIYFNGTEDEAWNDDYTHWEHQYMEGGEKKVVPTFAPLKETSVVYYPGDHILRTPEENADFQEPQALIEDKAQPYITYDINFEPYTCRRVFVPAHTTIVDQHFIHSFDAWQFDMPVVPNQWNMTAMPVHGVVTGDMFIPYNANGGDESKLAPFTVDNISQTVGTLAVDRFEYGIYNSMYNSKVFHYEASHGNPYQVEISCATWSLATNALHTPITDAMSWSLGLDVADAAKTYVMRLPKDENVYNYYRTDYWVGSSVKAPEVIDRDYSTYGRPVVDAASMTFTLSNEYPGNTFIFGNPSFAYLDLAAFYDANKSVISNVFYLSGVENGTQYEHNTGRVDELLGWTATGGAKQKIAPMTGVMLTALDNAVVEQDGKYTLTLTLTNDMLVTSEGKRAAGNQIMAAPAYKREIHIAAEAENFVSRALIAEDEAAHLEALQGEDAEVMMLDEMMTPFAVYTVAGGKALAINMAPADSVVAIPLALMSPHAIESEVLTFSGEDAFLADWDLIDNRTGRREQLSDGFSIAVKMAVDGTVRYYLEHARNNAPDVYNSLEDVHSAGFTAYAQDGQLTVYSAEDMHDFCVYDAAGRTLASRKDAGRLQQISLMPGVYMVLANGETRKVVVK